MTFSQAVKRNQTFAQLRAEAKTNTHSYMIVTPDTVTSQLFALSLVSLCTGKSEEQVEESADVYFLPQSEKVLISDADLITSQVHIMPTVLDKKYFIVRNAETTNEAAQNKLLKTLEEAPETAVIILLCANEYAMLPTVRSRCRIIRPAAYSDDVVEKVLIGEYGEVDNPSFIVAMADGNLSRLQAAVSGGTAAFDSALNLMVYMRKSSEILPYATQLIAKKDRLVEIIDCIELILRDCMMVWYRPEHVKLRDNVMDIRELSSHYTPEAVIRILPHVARARKRLANAGNVSSVVDQLLFSILEEKAKCQR